MKKEYIYLIIMLFVCQEGFSQKPITIINNDGKTRRKLRRLIPLLENRNRKLREINEALSEAVSNHKEQLRLQYRKNQYDRKNGFLASAASSASLSIATAVLSNYPKLPYITQSKREYLESKAMDKAILLSLTLLDASKIKSGKRQEIYRLRNELIREFSKNDREARKTLLFSAGGLIILNYEVFSELSKQMENIGIPL